MSHTARRFDRSARTIDGVAVTVTELVWPDEFRFFAVFLSDGTELTTDGVRFLWSELGVVGVSAWGRVSLL